MPSPPLFTDAFQSVLHILDSDVFLLLTKACLYRSTDEKAHLWSEAILTRVCEQIHLDIRSISWESISRFYI